MLKEFKSFAMKGNVIDMAVGIIIGAAFGKIVSSAVSDIIMPPLGILVGGINFTDLQIVLKDAVDGQAAVSVNYGNFVQASLNFLIVALAVFALVKALNSMKRQEENAPAMPPAPSNEEVLLAEIRDLLKASQSK